MDLQGGGNELADIALCGVADGEHPDATRSFPPMPYAGENPVGVVGAVIKVGRRGESADHAGWGGEFDLQIAAIRMRDIDRQFDVFDAHSGAHAEVKRYFNRRAGVGDGMGRRGG